MATLTGASPTSSATAHDDRGLPMSRGALRSVSALVVLILLTQRVGVPVAGSVTSIVLPLTYAFVGIWVVRRLLVVSPVRAGLFVVAVSACLLATAAVSWLGATRELSMSSLWLLILLYLPWVLRVRDAQGLAVVTRAGRTLVTTMAVLSVAGSAQLVGQLTGAWEWQDYLAEVVPSTYLVPDYNFSNELAYGVDVYKSTAFVLLEPSFLAQYCALGILIGIVLGVPAWKLLVLGCGLVSSVSGTGLVLLAFGAVLLVLRLPRRLRIGHAIAGVLTGALLLFSPVATFLLRRQDEFGQEGTSGNARFVSPYEQAWEGLLDDPARLFVGAGPGSIYRILTRQETGLEILYGTIPKLAFEYGILAGGLFALFLVTASLDRGPWRVIPASLVFMTFLLSGALLQPQTATLVWLLAGIGARGDTTTPEGAVPAAGRPATSS